MPGQEHKTIHRRNINGLSCEKIFNLISNQTKQPKGINESFINQINEVYNKGYSKTGKDLARWAFSCCR